MLPVRVHVKEYKMIRQKLTLPSYPLKVEMLHVAKYKFEIP